MIEREFIAQKTKEFYIKRYVEQKLNRVGISQIRLKKIPLGEKIIIDTSRPSLIVGSKGANIRDLTATLKKQFKLENPQIEINEVRDIYLDAMVVAEHIASSLERFGSARFKSVGHKMMENVINAGALGVEITVSGKIPGARAKNWRFYQGYLKKCGDVALTRVRRAQKTALLKTGVIGIKVSIMPPDVVLPDHIDIRKEPLLAAAPAEESKGEPKKAPRKRSAPRKKKGVKPKEGEPAASPVAPAEIKPVEIKKEEPALPEPLAEDVPASEGS